jgi:hypothetical protein
MALVVPVWFEALLSLKQSPPPAFYNMHNPCRLLEHRKQQTTFIEQDKAGLESP